MLGNEFGSLSKEVPMEKLDKTIRSVTPAMPYQELLAYARTNTHGDAPGLLRRRFLYVQEDGTIMYDRFLSLVHSETLESPIVRKTMYLVWALRDQRLRRFICERVADDSGKWRTEQLTNKSNADFFREWFHPATAAKARSNIEYFLSEVGIFNAVRHTIHLDLIDGWVHEAIAIAAQHERDPEQRQKLIESPISYLRESGWIGLTNSTWGEIKQYHDKPLDYAEPLEDDLIEYHSVALPSAKDWNRLKPKQGNRRSIEVLVNMVARERASRMHYFLECPSGDFVSRTNRLAGAPP